MAIRGRVISNVQPTPPRISIVSSAVLDPGAAADDRWLEGFSVLPFGCAEGDLTDAQCLGGTKSLEDLPAVVDYVPHAVFTGAHCSTLGMAGESVDTLESRALNNLAAVTPKQIERELWTGARAIADSLPNNYLTKASSLENLSPSGGDISPGAYALAALQEYLAGCADGGRGMIHAPRRVVTIWEALSVVYPVPGANILEDLYGNVIVPGVGYPGTGPGGIEADETETAWAYATSMIEVKLGRATLLPEAGNIAAALVRSTNDLEWRAERPVAAFWDGCCHAGIRVGVCATCCTPA